jgi:hypothetical protein
MASLAAARPGSGSGYRTTARAIPLALLDTLGTRALGGGRRTSDRRWRARLLDRESDRRIAERTIDRWKATGLIDEHYLAELGADRQPLA